MAFGRTFKEALQKAMRSLEQNRFGFGFDQPHYTDLDTPTDADLAPLRGALRIRSSTSMFDLCDALRFGITAEEIFECTKYDPWFIDQCAQIVEMAKELIIQSQTENTLPSQQELYSLKRFGFSDVQIATCTRSTEQEIRTLRKKLGVVPVYKTVDTCAAEFESETPYHYSTYARENEAVVSSQKKVIILGSGPNRIGQGIEFDYCCVQGVFALKELGYEAILINCNPETVSTDYDTTSRLYFEPLTFEDVMNVIDLEQPDGVIVTFGGQTPLKLAQRLYEAGVPLLGTSPEGIDLAEDRKRFGDFLKNLDIPCPPWGTARTIDEAVVIAEEIGYPVLVRPSYVLGGRAMQICYREDSLREYMRNAISQDPTRNILIDRFLENAYEFDVDAVSDGTDVVIGGIMQHIEEAGIHSGDSSCVIPPYNITDELLSTMQQYTRTMAIHLKVIGLLNIQFAVKDDVVYVLEVNPRASRTVPFVSKATGVTLAKVATSVMVGNPLSTLGVKDFDTNTTRTAIKESVFPFTKFPRVNVFLGPEMRSTGEVMGMDSTFGRAIVKSHISAGNTLPQKGTVFISLSTHDKTTRAAEMARGYAELGFVLFATKGTAQFLRQYQLPVIDVLKHHEGRPSIVDQISNGDVQIVINTPLGESARYDEAMMGRTAMKYKVPFFTTLAAAEASLHGIKALRDETFTSVSLQDHYASTQAST